MIRRLYFIFLIVGALSSAVPANSDEHCNTPILPSVSNAPTPGSSSGPYFSDEARRIVIGAAGACLLVSGVRSWLNGRWTWCLAKQQNPVHFTTAPAIEYHYGMKRDEIKP